ncbi:conserved hypothetical protein [Roseobacter denitrificans OCh 114]|uniref:FAS1 domain-containing protein n=2 Tax=Roseobacter denitrificans TaxID=2434 RepID=Q163P9_ROSDO|nr:conserved hypothetical protein [Roseobacter denitrificans OCh 114]
MHRARQDKENTMNRRSTLKAALAVTALTTISACATLTGGDDIVDVAASNGNFNTLVAAVQAAGLEDTLRSEGPFTVFAPTDDAFAALPAGTIEDLLLPENKDKLVGILTYHVIPGAVMAADVSGASTDVATVNGAMLTVDGTGDGVVVGGANVTAADIKASNGVIHVIDKVLLP